MLVRYHSICLHIYEFGQEHFSFLIKFHGYISFFCSHCKDISCHLHMISPLSFPQPPTQLSPSLLLSSTYEEDALGAPNQSASDQWHLCTAVHLYTIFFIGWVHLPHLSHPHLIISPVILWAWFYWPWCGVEDKRFAHLIVLHQ